MGEIGLPRNLLAKAHMRFSSSLSRAFSIRSWCSSNEIWPGMAGPPQLLQMGFDMASFIMLFSARSLSFSCLRIRFSCRSSWVCFHKLKSNSQLLHHYHRLNQQRIRILLCPKKLTFFSTLKMCSFSISSLQEYIMDENLNSLFTIYLHLGSSILKPELDLLCLQAKPLAEFQSLLLVRMRTLLEETETQKSASGGESITNRIKKF